MVNPRKHGPVHGRIQKVVVAVYRKLEEVGSFPNRLLKAFGLITMREHYLDMKKIAVEADKEIKRREVEVKGKAMEWKGSSKGVVDKALQDSYDEMEKAYLTIEKKHGEAKRDIKSLKTTLKTRDEEIRELEKGQPKVTSKEVEELKEALKKKNKEIKNLKAKAEALEQEVRRLTPRKGIYPFREGGKIVLSDEEVEELIKEGYNRVMTKDLDNNLMHFMVKVQGKEELQHAALNWMIYEEVAKYTRKLKTVPSSDSVDVSFTDPKGRSVGFEVETGSMLKKLGRDGFRKKIDDKLRQYDVVFIVLTDSDPVFVGKYGSLELGVDILVRSEVAAKIKGFFESVDAEPGSGEKPVKTEEASKEFEDELLKALEEPHTIQELTNLLGKSKRMVYNYLSSHAEDIEKITKDKRVYYQLRKS